MYVSREWLAAVEISSWNSVTTKKKNLTCTDISYRQAIPPGLQMSHFAHVSAYNFLKEKIVEFSWVNVHEVSEAQETALTIACSL